MFMIVNLMLLLGAGVLVLLVAATASGPQGRLEREPIERS